MVLLVVIGGFIAHQPLPTGGKTGPEADALARKMEAVVNKPAWDQTRFVSWEFRTGTTYLWDKVATAVSVAWGDNLVLLRTTDRSGMAYHQGQEVTDAAAKQKLLEQAWEKFANDSFWLCAPMKAFDPGTSREIYTQKDGTEALLVHYSSGGVTPGDSYLWLLDTNGRPRAWQLWVSTIPIGGLTFTWEDWTGGGALPQLALDHKNAILDVPILDLRFPTFTDAENPLKALF